MTVLVFALVNPGPETKLSEASAVLKRGAVFYVLAFARLSMRLMILLWMWHNRRRYREFGPMLA